MANRFLTNAVNKYQKYKFVIASENHVNDVILGWVTERVATAVLAGAIPIYFGTAKGRALFSQYFNVERVLWCSAESVNRLKPSSQLPYNNTDPEQRVRYTRNASAVDLAACAALVKEVDQDDERWKRIVRQPFLVNGTNNSIF